MVCEAEAECIQAIAEGALLSDYRYLDQRSGKAAKRDKVTVRIPGAKSVVEAAKQVAEAQNLARRVTDMPGNVCYPFSFVQLAEKAFADGSCIVKSIKGLSALKKAKFPGLVQVGMGSEQEPALLEIHYRPANDSRSKGGKAQKGGRKNTKKQPPHLALVGKGVTFDTGGISLKPGAGMWEMKCDMGGAAAMLGAMRLIADQKPDIAVSAYIALAENMPDGKAQKPGDIYQARNGLHIHVDNTDAEGRLVMSDVLTYACEEGAQYVVDAATLTGACLVALGQEMAGLMSNDDEFAQQIRSVGLDAGEEFWHLPLPANYNKLLDHPHADVNNIGGRYAGTLTAGLFLQKFVEEGVKWAHCDIAGPAINNQSWRYYTKGASGFGVRSFAALAVSLAEQESEVR